MLRDEGYIAIDRRSGCRVASEIPGADESLEAQLREKLLPIVAAAASHGMGPAEFQSLCEGIFKSLEGAS
jgi:DNA-binding transcriptional regulator YhcF (GntR family)